jgi:hypothetical protein
MAEVKHYGETDLTKWVLRTKSAPLSTTGTHEIVLAAETKGDVRVMASALYGTFWRKTYEIVRRTQPAPDPDEPTCP